MSASASPNYAATLDVNARTRPTHPAVVTDKGTITHAAFAGRVRGLSALLCERGVGPGTLVGVWLKESVAHLAALFAVVRLGAAIVPMDWRWTAEEAGRIARHFGVSHLLVEPDAAVLSGPARIALEADLLAAAAARDEAPPVAPGGETAMVLSLSSGTTGRPTGPMLTHARMWARTEAQLAGLTFNQHDRYLLATPLYFGGGRSFALTHLAIGATLILFPPPHAPAELVAAAARHRATSTFLVPTQIRRLLALADDELAGLAGLRLLVSSGAPLHPEERAEIARRITPGFFEYFASTEGGGITILAPADQARHPDSVGRPAFRVEVEVVGPDHRPLPAGEAGAIRYRGPGVAEGFFRDPERSAEAFRDGWFYPGDLGRMDAEGFLVLLGRAKNVVIRGGVNIYPPEVERVLEAHPLVAEAAVFGIPDREMGEEVAAAVVAREPLAQDALAAWCRDRLAPYKIPRRLVFLDELPRNAGGKVRLDALRARCADDG